MSPATDPSVAMAAPQPETSPGDSALPDVVMTRLLHLFRRCSKAAGPHPLLPLLIAHRRARP